jgi:hypothetical protein
VRRRVEVDAGHGIPVAGRASRGEKPQFVPLDGTTHREIQVVQAQDLARRRHAARDEIVRQVVGLQAFGRD